GTVIVAWGSMEDFGSEPSRAIVWSERRLVRTWNGRRRLFLVITPAEWRRLRRRLSRPAAVLAFERGRVLVTNAPLGARLGSAPRRAAEAHDRLGIGLGALEPDQVSRALDRLQPGAPAAGGEDPAGGRSERKAPDPPGTRRGRLGGNPSAHRFPDDVRPLQVERLDHVEAVQDEIELVLEVV